MRSVPGRGTRRVGAALFVASAYVVGQIGAAAAAPADLDLGFGGGDGIVTTDLGGYEEAAAVARQPDGKLVVVGRAGDSSYAGGDLLVARYTRDGRPDPGFGGGDGIVVTDIAGQDDHAEAVALQRDGRIVVAGRAYTGETGDPTNPNQPVDFTDSVVARYTRDGRLDRSFGGGDGIVVSDLSDSGDGATDVAVLPSGDIVTSGTSDVGSILFLRYRTAVVRYGPDGALDPSFGTDGVAVFEEPVRDQREVALATQRDGKLVVAAETNGPDPFSPVGSLAAMRLLPDGRLDSGFGGGDGVAEVPVSSEYRFTAGARDVQVQRDGKVVVAGTVMTPSGPRVWFAVARFTPDGAPDTSFDGDGAVQTAMDGFDEAVADGVALQRDGKLVAAGSVLNQGTSTWRQALARYNPDGSLDATFDGDGRLTTPAIGVASPTSDVLVQPDGRIVTAGGAGPADDDSDVAVVRFQGDRAGPVR